MSRQDEVRELLPSVQMMRKKSDVFTETVPSILSQSVQMADGDAAKCRQIASTAASAVSLIEARDWSVSMATEPGELVYDPQRQHKYLYAGKEEMTHDNPMFWPGAQGVYYWSVVPDIHEGYPVFPDVTGIVVFVKENSIWWDPSRQQKYLWAGDDYDCPSGYYPGATGVHQWERV